MAEEIKEEEVKTEGTEAEEVKLEESQVEEHNISLSLVKAPPDEVKAGADMVLQVSVSCSLACDLKGKTLRIMDKEEVLVDNIELTEFDGTANQTGEFVVEAPIVPGEYTWTAVFLPQGEEEALHEECSTPFTFIVKAHTTSMAVWGVPSPVELESDFKIKAGVKCSAECSLAGKAIEIYDQDGTKVATGTLSDVPYSDKVDLCWAEVELKAPGTEGLYKWQVKFPEPNLEIPHDETCHTFGFTTVRPAECELTVEVINKDTDTPIKNAWVILRPNLYRGCTDENGVVKIGLTKGECTLKVFASERAPIGINYDLGGVPLITGGMEFMLYVPEANKDNMLPFKETVKIEGDTTIRVELIGVIEPLEEDTL